MKKKTRPNSNLILAIINGEFCGDGKAVPTSSHVQLRYSDTLMKQLRLSYNKLIYKKILRIEQKKLHYPNSSFTVTVIIPFPFFPSENIHHSETSKRKLTTSECYETPPSTSNREDDEGPLSLLGNGVFLRDWRLVGTSAGSFCQSSESVSVSTSSSSCMKTG